MRLTASDYYSLYRPSKCGLRVYLRQKGEEESPPGPYAEIIKKIGLRHEKAHLDTFPSYEDISVGIRNERITLTKEKVSKNSDVIYQPVLMASHTMDGHTCEIVGEPDFFIFANNGYIIRDSKISRRINAKDHPEIIYQLLLYGWLFEQTFGESPKGLQVHSGVNKIVDIPYMGIEEAFLVLQNVLNQKLSTSDPYSPVGWSKCGGCGFHGRCWPEAERRNDAALIAGVDQGLAIALRGEGVETVDQFLSSFDEARLSEFKRPWGKGMRKVGKNAASIIRMAQSMASNEEIIIQPPAIPDMSNYVMFDLEGLPPQMDELEKVYLWGLQVFGKKPGEFLAAASGFGVDGDREGWEDFLNKSKCIFDEHGDIHFVHWHHYERVKIDMYIERFGDPDGIAQRVNNNLLDLLPITNKSIALPLPSYSLKVIEKYIGYKRTQDEYGGDWAMAKYIEAIETQDEGLRNEVMEQILIYNKEDLEATWAVLQWLKSKF